MCTPNYHLGESNSMATYQCPFCDYEDSDRKSVEAHISGKSNSLHDGKVGRMYRSEIEQEGSAGTIVGRLFGGAGESRQSEIDELVEVTRHLEEQLEELEEEVGGLGDRVDTLEEQWGEEVEPLIEHQKTLAGEIMQTKNAVTEVSWLLRFTLMTDGSGQEPQKCYNCREEVQFMKTSKGHLYCPNCQKIAVAGYFPDVEA